MHAHVYIHILYAFVCNCNLIRINGTRILQLSTRLYLQTLYRPYFNFIFLYKIFLPAKNL